MRAIEWPEFTNLDKLDQLCNSVAVVGMSCRYAGANNIDEYWKLLTEGRCEVSSIPEGRWIPEKVPWINEGTLRSKACFLSCPIDEIDNKFFGFSPKELEYMDPQHRMLLKVEVKV